MSSGRHCWTICSRWRSDGVEQRQPLGHDLAEHRRALAAAGDEDLAAARCRRTPGTAPRPAARPRRAPDCRPARSCPVARLQPVDLVISGGDRRRFAGQQPVDPAEHGILLVQAWSGCASRSPRAAPGRPDSRRSRPPRPAGCSRYSRFASRRPAITDTRRLEPADRPAAEPPGGKDVRRARPRTGRGCARRARR